MAVKTKKIKSAGRFGAGYGRIKQKLIAVESKQKIKQKCPFCGGTAKRQVRGIWECKKCKKRFAGDAFYLSKT